MRKKIDPSNELKASDFESCDIVFTHESEELKDVQFFIVAVPTPIDEKNKPDLSFLKGACKIVGAALKESKSKFSPIVIFESTVFRKF